MVIQVNTDSNIEGNRELAQQIKTVAASSLERFGGQITGWKFTLAMILAIRNRG